MCVAVVGCLHLLGEGTAWGSRPGGPDTLVLFSIRREAYYQLMSREGHQPIKTRGRLRNKCSLPRVIPAAIQSVYRIEEAFPEK